MNTTSPADRIFGYCCLIGALFGIFLFGSGIAILIQVSACGSVDCDYTGLGMFFGMIVGPALILLGAIISYFLVPLTLRRLRWGSEKIIFPALLVLAVPLVWGFQKAADLKAKVHRERQAVLDEMTARDKEIGEEFQNHPYSKIMVICKIREGSANPDLPAWQAQMRQFALDRIIKPLGSGIRNYEVNNWGDYDTYFVADLTRESYELLKQEKHVWKMELYKSFQQKCAAKPVHPRKNQ